MFITFICIIWMERMKQINQTHSAKISNASQANT